MTSLHPCRRARSISRPQFPGIATSLYPLLFVMLIVALTPAARAESPPNVVFFFADDLGYGDLGCYGGQANGTVNLDRMAREGIRFTDFYVAQAVCGASRAALLTGCYPNRIGLLGAPNHQATHGISEREWTLAEMFRNRGYATAIYGKWHLGHRQKFLPLQHGFDEYLGLPYSNDMWPRHPSAPKGYPPLPLIQGNDVKIADVTPEDQSQLTTWYTEGAIDFIRRHSKQPFFVYVPYAMPHVPLYVSSKHQGKMANGLYGDVLAEIDWSVGQVEKTLAELNLTDNTLVIFSSDNGPWLSYGNHAGVAGPLREGKGTAWEGGVRVPFLAKWPARIRPGLVCRELAATIDIMPTLASLVGGKQPELTIDGLDIGPLLTGDAAARTPHQAYCYYWGNELQAIRSGAWKLHFPHSYRSLTGTAGRDGQPGGYTEQKCGLELYDLDNDVGEKHDVSVDHPDVVRRLSALADKFRQDLGDSLQKTTGTGLRPAGKLD